MKKIKLGTKVIDKVTGFTGIATSRVEYINGCVQYGVTPKVKKDDTTAYPESTYVDEGQLELIKETVNIKKEQTGGVRRDAPKR